VSVSERLKPNACEALKLVPYSMYRADAIGDVLTPLHQQAERRSAARSHGPSEHGGLHRVDDREDELFPGPHGC
jgi:hypothetical protein